MKSVRIVRVILLLALAAYLWLFHTANRQSVELPILNYFLPPIPVAYVVAFALVVGWLVGYAPARLKAWRRGRELIKLRARVAELEAPATLPARAAAPIPAAAARTNYAAPEPELPIIPDRGNPYHETHGSDDEAG